MHLNPRQNQLNLANKISPPQSLKKYPINCVVDLTGEINKGIRNLKLKKILSM